MKYSREDKIRIVKDFLRLQKSMALEIETLELFKDDPVVTTKQLDQNFRELVDQHCKIVTIINRQLLTVTVTGLNESAGIAQIEDLYWELRHQRLDYQRKRRDFFRQTGYLSQTSQFELKSDSQAIPVPIQNVTPDPDPM